MKVRERRLWKPGMICGALCTSLLLAADTGCTSIDQLRGDGFQGAENWGGELRKQKNGDVLYGGVSTKAQQIERNLGVQ